MKKGPTVSKRQEPVWPLVLVRLIQSSRVSGLVRNGLAAIEAVAETDYCFINNFFSLAFQLLFQDDYYFVFVFLK